MNLQKLYELRLAEQKSGETIKGLPPLVGACSGHKRAMASLEQQFRHFLWGASDNREESPSRLIGL